MKEEIMSENTTEPGHGDSLAAWVTVSVIILAFALGTLFFWFDQAVLVWASAGLAVLGLVAGWYLKKAGYGVGGSKSNN
jgi:membrane protein YdbS with pleckstrin-like domain